MAGHYLRKRLRTAGLARRLASFAAILLIASALVLRFGGIDPNVFAILLGIVAALALIALLFALFGLVRVWRRGHEGGGAALAAFLISCLVAAPFAVAAALALENPATNMAETDGMLDADAGAAEFEPSPASDTAANDAVIDGRVFAANASQIYQAVRVVLGDAGWTVSDVETADPKADEASVANDASKIVPRPGMGAIPIPTPREAPGEPAGDEASEPDPLDRPESGEYRIAAVARDPVLALPSDVEIRIVEDDTQGYLDLRSTSRFGAVDFGQNRRFIEGFLARVDAAMIGIGTPAKG